MNKRIKEFIDVCSTTYVDRNGCQFIEFDKEKFAELIVNGCAAIVSLYKRDNMQDTAIADTMEQAYREIKLSFGMKL